MTDHDRTQAGLSWAVLVAALVHNVYVTWLRWGDPVVDCGRELEVARLIARGDVLYGDVRHYFGPLAPYLNGLLFAVFGAHAGVLMAAGVASAAAMAAVLYALAQRLAGRLAATAVAVAFLYLCAFGHYYFNHIFTWVLPYTYSATYGMLAATASLFFLVRHVEDGRGLHLSIGCLVLAALGRVEAALPAAAAHLVFVATKRPRLGPYVGGAAAALGVFALFLAAVGPQLVGDYLHFALSPKFRAAILLHSGLGGWRDALGPIGWSAGALAAGAVLVWGASLVEARLPRWATAVACGVGAAIAYRGLTVFDQFRALPLLIMLMVAARCWRRAGLAPTLVLVFALACLVRMPLSTGAFHYGFYLLPVPLLAFALFWFRELPAWLPGRPERLAACAGIGALAAIVLIHVQTSRILYALHNTLVEGPRGAIYVLDELQGFPTGRAYADAVRFLSRYPSSTRMLAIPEGAGLGFLAGLESVCGMHSFLPPELDGPFEDRLLTCLYAAPPDLVVRVGINLGEFGSRGFGEDYAERTTAWILANYAPIAAFGPGGYVAVFGRRER